jgi:hypothetical protein
MNEATIPSVNALSITDDPQQNRIVIVVGRKHMTVTGINARAVRETIQAEGEAVLSSAFWRGFAFALQLASPPPAQKKKE